MPECVFVGLVSYNNMIPPCFFGGMAHSLSLRRICHARGCYIHALAPSAWFTVMAYVQYSSQMPVTNWNRPTRRPPELHENKRVGISVAEINVRPTKTIMTGMSPARWKT